VEAASSPVETPGQVWLEIVIPARNESARLPGGLAVLCKKAATLPHHVEILVVDNASTDQTAQIVRDWPVGPVPVRLLSCSRRGKGAAVRAGLLATRAPYVGFCDADMATDLSALDVALGLLQAGATMVIGSRSHPESVVEARHSVIRRAGAFAFRAAARVVTPDVRDTQCGFKFFAGSVARAAVAPMQATGFSFDIELIARCQRQGARPVQIPVDWRDKAGSSFSVRRHALSAFAEVGAIWLTLRKDRWRGLRVLGVWRRLTTTVASALARMSAPANAGAMVGRGAEPEVATAAFPCDALSPYGSAASHPLAGRTIAVINWRDPWHPDNGGAERYAWEMALGLRARGARICYVTARGSGQGRRDHRDGIEILRLGGKWTVYPRVLAWLLPRRWSFEAVLDCQNGIPFFTPLVLPRRVRVICVMHHVHDAQFGVHFAKPVAAVGRWLEGPFSRVCYRHRECVAVSESTASAMRSRLKWTGPIHIIPNGLPADAAEHQPSRDISRAGPGDPPSLSLVGRLVTHKRTVRVLEVANRLRGTGIVIDVIGTGPEYAALASEIVARRLDDGVRLRGYLPELQKRDAVARSLLHLNTSQGEGWGLCVLEAAALGVPTVAYDVEGLRDAVRDAETGWLVAAQDRMEDVVERALKELADPRRRAEVAAACRAWAANFDWDRSAAMMAELLAGTLDSDASDLPSYASDGGKKTR